MSLKVSEINFEVDMKHLKVWGFTCVCTISLNFEIYFLQFTWEIVFGRLFQPVIYIPSF